MMQQGSSTVADACGEIAQRLLSADEPTAEDARRIVRSVCSRRALERIPKKQEILAAAGPEGYGRLHSILLKKPTKTGSGVAVVALMPMPYACPHGRCTYCPGGVASNTPNSYTGAEPAAQSAIRYGYDPVRQITTKVDQLVAYGHSPAKLELVIVGGTFMFMPAPYREWFAKSCYDALNGAASETLEAAQRLNERAAVRNVGFTVETKPDYCKEDHVETMLRYGVTRVEIGVQSLRERIYRTVNRGHTFGDVAESFQAARDAGLKIVAHMMPGLPTATPDEDKEDLARLFGDERLRPDMLKIYPCLVLRDTPLYEMYKAGEYKPYDTGTMLDVLATAKAAFPEWVRVMRVQREIPPADIVAGPRYGNLRQMVHREMSRRRTRCDCIRCREPRGPPSELERRRVDYAASGGHETFISYVDRSGRIYGFIRLRMPGNGAGPEDGAALVRELHVYGRALGLGERGGIQHSGLGRRLLAEAEGAARREHGAGRVLVTSAVGTREYYRASGYSLYGPYMAKTL